MSRRKEQMKRRRRFFSMFLIVAIIATIGGGVYSKIHHVESCEILNVVENTVYVKHANGLTYAVDVKDPEVYQDIDTAKVIFDQLTDWEKNYYIVDISPIR